MNASSLGTVQLFKLVLNHAMSSGMDGRGVVRAEVPSARILDIIPQGTKCSTAKYNL